MKTTRIAVILLPLLLRAQSVNGTVYDPGGAVVPGATARLQPSTSGTAVITTTDATGNFSFNNLVPGTYTLEILQKGFRAFTNRSLAVQGDQTIQADANLELGEIQLVDTITAPRPAVAPVAPVTRATGPQRIRVGGNVQPAKVLKKVEPAYPESARAAGIEGVVRIEAVIARDGFVRSAFLAPAAPSPVGLSPDLTTAALDAIKQWQFQPTLLNGEPIETLTHVDMRFRLQ